MSPAPVGSTHFSTLKGGHLNSNKIYVIDSGGVVAEGNHQELMSTSSIYKNFYNKQIKV